MQYDKLSRLDKILKDLKSFAIGFSGGLDSAFLIHRAHSLKNIRFVAVTIRTVFIPEREIRDALEFTSTWKIDHKIIELSFPQEIKHNPSERCYLCKKIIFSRVEEYARENGYKYLLDGTNSDDLNEVRPGLRALNEMEVISPLAQAGLTKAEIRQLAYEAGLKVWDKPAMSCLLTRIPYDTEISEEMLRMIEKAEDYLFDKGFPGTRVRIHGDVARIECIPGFIPKIVNDPNRETIIEHLKNIGFRYISLDLEGYRTGSMNSNKLK